jgi:hypothetical protein
MPDEVIMRLNQLYLQEKTKELKRTNIDKPINDWELQDFEASGDTEDAETSTKYLTTEKVPDSIFNQGQLIHELPALIGDDYIFEIEPEIENLGDTIQSIVEALDEANNELNSDYDIGEADTGNELRLRTISNPTTDTDRVTQGEYVQTNDTNHI